MARIIFSHANSFPASTYQVLLDNLRQRGFVVDAVEKFGHDPQYPVTNNWPHLVQQLADFARDLQG
ncbi:MAG: alpha/beta hydrolase, partial [Burkholderiales bacterium]